MARTSNSARKSTKPVKKSEEPVKKTQEAAKTIPNKTTSKPTQIAEKKPASLLSVSTPKISQKPKPHPKKASKNILREIKYYQNNIGFLIPRALLIRVVRQTLLSTIKGGAPSEMRFTSVSLNVLHEALENHLVCIIELSYMAARHAKRITLFPSDIRLINRIKGITI